MAAPRRLLPLFLLLTIAAAAPRPEQVHVAFGSTPDQLIVQWSTLCSDGPSPNEATAAAPPKTQVRYGLSPEALDHAAEGLTTLFTDSGAARRRQWMHVANLTGLGAWPFEWRRVAGICWMDGWMDGCGLTSRFLDIH